ncbi:MAG: nucleotidyl transferase AbiEii/AbiGii toxin family protein [bacterium]
MNIKSFNAVLKALHEYNVEYILVGGLAVILHGVPRVTEDLDIFIRSEAANVENLKKALASVFDDTSINEIGLSDLDEYPVVRYGTPENYYIDIMDRVGQVFKYDDLEYEVIESRGICVRIATIETLIKLKEGTIRTIDKADVILLTEILQKKK